MGWEQIHAGGWMCSHTGEYVATDGPPPDAPCQAPLEPLGRPNDDPGWIEVANGVWLNTITGQLVTQDPGGDIVVTDDPQGATLPMDSGIPDWLQDLFGGRGGGGRRGGAGAQYVQPAETQVEELVKATLIAMTGTFDQGRVDQLIRVFLDTDRKNFDSKTEAFDPLAAVKDVIRQYGDYEAIHKLRPEETDEMEWIADRRAALARLGLSDQKQVDLATTAATAGLTGDQTETLGQIADFEATGRAATNTLRNKLRGSVRSGMRLLR